MHNRKQRPIRTSLDHISDFFQGTGIEHSSPLVYLPDIATADEQLDIIKRIICRVRNLDTDRLTELADGAAAIEAATSLNSHIFLRHMTPFVYGEKATRMGRQQPLDKIIGDAGSVKLHWVDGKSRYLGGWLYNIHVEVACHADANSSSEHWALTASIQLDNDGSVIDIMPAIASSEGGDSYGIRRARCICRSLKNAGVIINK